MTVNDVLDTDVGWKEQDDRKIGVLIARVSTHFEAASDPTTDLQMYNRSITSIQF